MHGWCRRASVVLAAACSSVPDGVLDKEDMASLMADIHTAESMMELDRVSYRNDSARMALKQTVYARHGVTAEQFDSTLVWYGHNLDKYVEVYERVGEILQQRMDAIDADLADLGLAVVGDSADAWGDLRSKVFDRHYPGDFLSFSIKADDTWENGDRYLWRMKTFNNMRPVRMVMVADYDDGRSEMRSSVSENGDGWHELSLELDSTRVATRVYGSALIDLAGKERVFVDSISLVRTRVNPARYWSSRRNVEPFDYGRKIVSDRSR